jgi:bifunctional DNA-binding transcriptional regulator/antitoxin component of YhaV-PrlF toxin-antitoxin module
MRFTSRIELGGKTATGIPVPEEVVQGLGRGKRVPVVVTVGGHSYRSTIAAYNGLYMLPLAAEHREAAGLTAGDEVEVDVELDDAPREVVVPEDLASALAADASARTAFDRLSYSNKRRIVLSIEGAKAAETRARRIDRALAELLG